ncbi:OmpA family protein [Serratia fonticola]|uniref:OmpA family protein n=1 Tax=Serratia fonticola TaxID=47917 RepID=A0A542BPS5_SERFO|nr:OmpA family protein [Serratia fonticola]TQI80555.1 OmpA family protein [Serratia fonticola]TQI97420.1 OmpA family protein [Serratia fonticola]TVZ71916.1 OmpA family protein [Serratia fonticola]
MYTMENVVELHKEAISPQLLTLLEQKLTIDQQTIGLCLTGMGALILQSTHDYLHRNENARRFRLQIQQTPLFEPCFLDEATRFKPILLTMVLDNRLRHLTQRFGIFYAVEKQVAEYLFSVSSALLFGILGRYLRQRSIQSLSLKGWLNQQLPMITAAQPEEVLNLFPPLIPADPAVSRTGSLPPPKRRTWPWQLLLLLLLVTLLFSLRGFSGLQPKPDSHWTSEQGELAYRRLADGKQLHLAQHSVENLLITYIESHDPVNEKHWFTLDRLLFAPESTNLTPGSQEQLKNIVDILRAYPNVEIRLGGYSDRTGNEQMDQRLSQDRADAVRMALVKMGISEGRVSAEGYGSAYPLVPNDSEIHRAKNRRIDLRVIEK